MNGISKDLGGAAQKQPLSGGLATGNITQTSSAPLKLTGSGTVDLRSLEPGQMFTGQITDIRSGFVKVNVGGQAFQARFESSVAMSMGEVMNFVVRENNGGKIFIAPVQGEPMSFMDAALYKALKAAGLPATDKNIDVVSELLNNQMSVDKKSIQQMLSLSYQFPDTEIKDLTELVKYKIPVTEGNLEQLTHYKNNLHSLTHDMKDFIDSLPKALERLLDNKGMDGPYTLLKELNIFQEKGNGLENQPSSLFQPEALEEWGKQPVLELLKEAKTPEELKSLFQKEEFRQAVSKELLDQWTIEPEHLNAKSVNKAYETMKEHMEAAKELLSDREDQLAASQNPSKNGNGEKEILSPAKNLQNNLEFIKDINQQFFYAQLPLHLKEQITHGDLYVFAKKKNGGKQGEGFRVLLHLDMEHLGGTDVLINLHGRSLRLTFTLEQEEAVLLLQSYQNVLEESLEKKGFQVSAQFQRQEEKAFDFTEDFLGQEQVHKTNVTKYSFDMRA